jgi:hypothetical protein
MPVVRKIEPPAPKGKPIGTRLQQRALYDELLVDFQPGDYGEVDMDDGTQPTTIRARMKHAARRRGLVLTFLKHRRFHGKVFHVDALPASEVHI